MSALYGQGKKKAFQPIQRDVNSFQFLDCFSNPGNTKEEIASAGERFILQLYGVRKIQSLDRFGYIAYNHAIGKTSLSSSFKLESLSPTSAAAKQHSYRTFHTVQQWLGNNFNPTKWGWTLTDRMFLLEWINLWPQNACLKWYRVTVKQDVVEPAAAGTQDCMVISAK